MSLHPRSVSYAFQLFLSEAPAHAQAWNTAVDELRAVSAMDPKTTQLAFLAVLAALGRESGLPFHVGLAKKAGATRDEVISALLVGLPAAGTVVTAALPAALTAYDAE